jgi:hypothetical protein
MCGKAHKAFESLVLWTFSIVFLFTASAVFHLANRAAKNIVLDWVYGAETVRQEHLQLTHTVYGERVSNGDMLSAGWATILFLTEGAISLPSFLLPFLLLFFLMPSNYRRVLWAFSKEVSASQGRGWPIPVLLMFIPTIILLAALGKYPLACGLMAVGAVVSAWIVTGLVWLMRGQPRSENGANHGQ